MTVEQRLERLERENRRWRSVAVCLAALFTALLTCTQSPTGPSAGAAQGGGSAPPGVLRATGLQIVTEKGDIVAALGGDEAGATLYFGAANNRAASVRLSNRDNASRLTLSGPDGDVYINHSSFVLFGVDPAKKQRRDDYFKEHNLAYKASKDWTAEEKEFWEANTERPVFHIGMSNERGGQVDVCNVLGKVVVSAGTDKMNRGAISVMNADGRNAKTLSGPQN